MAKWSLDLSKYAEKKRQDIEKVRKQSAFQCFKSIVEKTPVDTGRARANWIVSVGKENPYTYDITDKAPLGSRPSSKSLVDAGEKIESVKGDESIYIQNNLPYIKTLEYGHSKQAPSGMVGLTMMEFDNFVRREIEETR